MNFVAKHKNGTLGLYLQVLGQTCIWSAITLPLWPHTSQGKWWFYTPSVFVSLVFIELCWSDCSESESEAAPYLASLTITPPPIVRLRSQTNADWQNPALELWLEPKWSSQGHLSKTRPLISCPTRSSQTQMVFSCPLTPPWLSCSSQRTRLDHLEWPRLCNRWLRFKRLVPPHALISSQGFVGPWCNRNWRVS